MKWTGQGLGSPSLFKVENISYLECEYPVNKCLCPNKYSIVKLCLILLVPSDPPNTKLQRWASLVVSQTLHLVPQLSWSRGAGNPSILSSKLFVSEDPDHHLVSQTGWSSGSQTTILSPNTWLHSDNQNFTVPRNEVRAVNSSARYNPIIPKWTRI